MSRFFKFMGASLKMLYRDRMALFWLFLFPLLLMLLLGTIFGKSGQADISLGFVDLDRSQISKGIESALEGIEAFNLKRGTEKELLEELGDAKINAVLILESGFAESVTQGKPGKAVIYVDRSSPNVSEIAASTVNQVLDEIAREIAARAPGGRPVPRMIDVEQKSVSSGELSYVDFIVPGVLAITLMTSGLMGLSLDFVNYREKGILRRIKVSPLPLSRFLGAEITAAMVMSLIQAVILLAVGKLVFGIDIRGDYLSMAVVVLIGSASFLAMGFMISSLVQTFKTAEAVSNVVSFPMMFLSGVFFPLALMPDFLASVARVLPLYYLGDALREVMIKGNSLFSVWLDIVVLIAVGLACFGISVRFFRWE
jgi:ABC-2 type transport system permease protein